MSSGSRESGRLEVMEGLVGQAEIIGFIPNAKGRH